MAANVRQHNANKRITTEELEGISSSRFNRIDKEANELEPDFWKLMMISRER